MKPQIAAKSDSPRKLARESAKKVSQGSQTARNNGSTPENSRTENFLTPANNNPSNQTSRQPNSNQPRQRARNNILGIVPSTPKEIEERRKSVASEPMPSAELSPESRAQLPENIRRLLEKPTEIRQPAKDSILETEAEVLDEGLPAEPLPQPPPLPTEEEVLAYDKYNDIPVSGARIKKIRKELSSAGYELSEEEIIRLFNSDFKVKFPWAIAIGYALKAFVEIQLIMTSFVFSALGTGGNVVGWLLSFVPIFATVIIGNLGRFAGIFLTAVGIGIGWVGMLLSFCITIVIILLRIVYSRTASDVIEKISPIRRRIYKTVVRGLWRTFLGRIIPVVGFIIGAIVDIYSLRKYLIKETEKIKNIITQTR